MRHWNPNCKQPGRRVRRMAHARLGAALSLLFLAALTFSALCEAAEVSDRIVRLRGARNWGYQIQWFGWDDWQGQPEQFPAFDALVNSSYDVLVIEPQNTVIDDETFPAAQLVARIKNSDGSRAGTKKLAIAYIDIGEAEDYRTYWQSTWTAPTSTSSRT